MCRRCKVTVRLRKGVPAPECPVCACAVEWKLIAWGVKRGAVAADTASG